MGIKVENIKRKSTSRRNHWEINKSNDHRNIGTAGFQSLSPDVCKSSFIYIYIYFKQVKFELKFPIYQLIKRISKMSFLTSGMPYCGRNQKARFLLWIEQRKQLINRTLEELIRGRWARREEESRWCSLIKQQHTVNILKRGHVGCMCNRLTK